MVIFLCLVVTSSTRLLENKAKLKGPKDRVPHYYLTVVKYNGINQINMFFEILFLELPQDPFKNIPSIYSYLLFNNNNKMMHIFFDRELVRLFLKLKRIEIIDLLEFTYNLVT